MSQIKPTESNPILDFALNYEYPPYKDQVGTDKIVAFGDASHKCPIYVEQQPPCNDACPAGNDIRAWLTTMQQVKNKKWSMDEAYKQLWKEVSKTQPLAAVCGRVCPNPCEGSCNRNEKEGSVNINAYERWIGDYAIKNGFEHEKLTDEKRPEKIAVVGSGPAGLSCAFQLARRGYDVTIFEAFRETGGMLRYGIPAYRLPREVIDAEVAAIERMGVEIRCNTVVGKDISLDELKETYDSVYLGIGAHKGIKLGMEGEDAENVFSGAEFLNRIHAGKSVAIGDRVVVIGGGDTAIDAARVSLRLGAKVTILYRRTRNEMPAIAPEIEEALEENVDIRFLTAPIGIVTENGRAVAVRCQRMELGEPDKSGRRRPVAVEGSEFEVPCSALIPAISQEPEWLDAERYVSGRDWLKPGKDFSLEDGVYTGGDAINLGLVCGAIGDGRKAAENIHARFTGEFPPMKEKKVIKPSEMSMEYYEDAERNERTHLAPDVRLKGALDLEIDQGITEEQFLAEAHRCMSCGLCFDCKQCVSFCPHGTIKRFKDNPVGEVVYTKYSECEGCHLCHEICPCGYIQMGGADGL